MPESFSASLSRGEKTETRSRPPPTRAVLIAAEPEGNDARESSPVRRTAVRDPLSVQRGTACSSVGTEGKIVAFTFIVSEAVSQNMT